MLRVLETLASGEYSIEEIDAITGPAMGRPKSATFRTADIAGIDVMAHVVRNIAERLPADVVAAHFTMPAIVEELVEARVGGREVGAGLLQARQGRGRQERDSRARSEDLRVPPAAEAEAAVARGGAFDRMPSERVKTLFLGQDKVGTFLRDTLGPTLIYTAQRRPGHRHTPSTTSIGRCGGDSAGTWARSSSGTRSGSRTC